VNINDDGIDLKSYDTAVVNCYIQGTGRNAVKFWRNGGIFNSILYNVTNSNDGAIVIDRRRALSDDQQCFARSSRWIRRNVQL
jgi:hypothetical protein